MRLAIAGFLAVALTQSASAADADIVLAKAKLLFIDPQDMQPGFECKSDDPKVEVICLRSPVSFTVDLQDVMLGNGLARRVHAILWIHTQPPGDLILLGRRTARDHIDVNEWAWAPYGICNDPERIAEMGINDQVKALELSGRLHCKRD